MSEHGYTQFPTAQIERMANFWMRQAKKLAREFEQEDLPPGLVTEGLLCAAIALDKASKGPRVLGQLLLIQSLLLAREADRIDGIASGETADFYEQSTTH